MTVINLHPEGRGKTPGSNAPGAFLVIPNLSIDSIVFILENLTVVSIIFLP